MTLIGIEVCCPFCAEALLEILNEKKAELIKELREKRGLTTDSPLANIQSIGYVETKTLITQKISDDGEI